MRLYFSGLQTQIPKQSLGRKLPAPQFGVIPDDVLEILEKTKDSPDSADRHLIQVIESGVQNYIRLVKGIKRGKSVITWENAFYDQSNKLAILIGSISSKNVLEKVVNLMNEEPNFNQKDFPKTYEFIMATLVQKASELNHPYRQTLQ